MKTLLTALVTGLVVFSLEAAEPKTHPKTILIIRHAEKPQAGPDLSPEGAKRAEALPDLFKKSATRPNPFPTPGFIFAAEDSEMSNRPLETVQPLADQLKLKVHSKIKDKDYAELVEELTKPKYDGKTVLICWHHGQIKHLAEALGVVKPPKFDEAVFDQVWVVTFDEKKPKLTIKPQSLPGDSKE